MTRDHLKGAVVGWFAGLACAVIAHWLAYNVIAPFLVN